VELRAMLGRARPAAREDLVFDENAAQSPPTAPSWDAGELAARVGEARARLRQLGIDVMSVLAGGVPSDDIDTIDPSAWAQTHVAIFDDAAVLGRTRELGLLALRAADFGVTIALPPIRFENADDVIASLRAAVVNGFVQVVTRMRATAAAVDAGDLIEASHALFGRAFVVAPASLGVAFGAEGPRPKPAQLPAQTGDAWLGLPLPVGYEPSSDKLSIVLLEGDGWSGNDAEVVGILVDQWTETIPNRTESTGVALHYDSPDSMPPQSLLLAVPPVVRGTWRWDDLVRVLHDTLDLARSRAVEPEHLVGEVYGQLLPAITGELVPDHLASDDGDVTGSRVILDFGINNAS
jgi:hypothetical protein